MEWEYGTAKIKFSEQAKRFAVFFEGDDSGRAYDSWEQATAAISAREERQEKQNRVKINVPVVDADLKRYVISGVHGGHGGYLSKPTVWRRDLYLDHPHVLGLIADKQRAQEELDSCESSLKPFELDTYDHTRKQKGLDTSEGIAKWAEETSALADAATAKAKSA